MRRRSGVLDAYGGCNDCGDARDEPRWTNRKNALALAAQHAKRYNHSTWAEQAIIVHYNPKDRAQCPECDLPISPGQRISKMSNGSFIHERCA